MGYKRVDRNQPELVEQIRKLGASVACTHMVGNGFVDAVVGWMNDNYLFEIKDPKQPPSKRRLTPDEEKFHAKWKGNIHKVETIDDVIRVFNARKTSHQ